MQSITTIGLDIAKSVFQVHGIDAEDRVIIRRQLKRRYVLEFFQKLPPCLIGIEACASSHHWSRELQSIGHTVRLMPPAYVKPYVKRQKNDAADAEATLSRSAAMSASRCARSARMRPWSAVQVACRSAISLADCRAHWPVSAISRACRCLSSW
jgi:transposase